MSPGISDFRAHCSGITWTLSATTLLKDALGESLATKPHVVAWLKTIGERPAVQRGMAVPKV